MWIVSGVDEWGIMSSTMHFFAPLPAPSHHPFRSHMVNKQHFARSRSARSQPLARLSVTCPRGSRGCRQCPHPAGHPAGHPLALMAARKRPNRKRPRAQQEEQERAEQWLQLRINLMQALGDCQALAEAELHPVNKGPPAVPAELSEDAHFMMRCLFRCLPLDRITKQTNSSMSEDCFARKSGRKFATCAEERDAVGSICNVRRIRKDAILRIVRRWLNSKVGERWNTFQWEGFTMSRDELASVTGKAHADWLAGYR